VAVGVAVGLTVVVRLGVGELLKVLVCVAERVGVRVDVGVQPQPPE
jgi:hypothetical protein